MRTFPPVHSISLVPSITKALHIFLHNADRITEHFNSQVSHKQPVSLILNLSL